MEYGLSEEQCFKIAASFGGGIGKSAEHLCGAVNGALIVLGLHFTPKEVLNQKVKQLLNTLKQNHNSLNCKDILKETGNHTMHSDKCRNFLIEVCDALDKILIG